MRTLPLMVFAISSVLLTGCTEKKDSKEAEKYEQTSPALEDTSKYSPDTVKNYEGRILEVYSLAGPYETTNEIGILLETDRGSIPIRLGPSNFVLSGPIRLTPGQPVKVKGSEQIDNGQIFVIARELQYQDYTLKLRDKKGNPLWTGWRKD